MKTTHAIRLFVTVAVAAIVCGGQFAVAGTTTIDFTQDIGNLTEQVSGAGVLTRTQDCRADLSAAAVIAVSDGGGEATVTDDFVMTMTLHPFVDGANGGVGLYLENSSNPSERVTIITDDFGDVALVGPFATDFDTFDFPNATNNFIEVTWDKLTDTVDVSLSNTRLLSIQPAFLGGANSVHIGVISGGPAGFEEFSATGPGVPDLDSTGMCPVDTDGDGLFDNEEALLCTDPLKTDTDTDGRSDWVEVTNNGTTDVVDYMPNVTHTDACEPDTDMDGVIDGLEVAFGTDPLDPFDFPASLPVGGALPIVLLGLGVAGAYLARNRRK